MTDIRTYFWHDRIKSRWRAYRDRYLRGRQWNDFIYGNSGDIFTRDVLAWLYPGTNPINVSEGPRILCVGSIGHKIGSGDVLSGIGCKTPELPTPSSKSTYIHALRGPISYDIFKSAGYDVSQVRFLADPGLLIGSMVSECSAIKGRVIFIPHYRERRSILAGLPQGMQFVDVDCPPLRIAKQIQRAECVYSSSLHGLIFAHALKRPCVFVRPATEEPLLKYQDYFLSVGISPPKPLDSISDAKFFASPMSPATLSIQATQIVFPTLRELKAWGIVQ
jgi:pyruvyltransferase